MARRFPAVSEETPLLPGAEGFLAYLELRLGHIDTTCVVDTEQFERWNIYRGGAFLGTYTRANRAHGFPYRSFDGIIPGYLNETAVREIAENRLRAPAERTSVGIYDVALRFSPRPAPITHVPGPNEDVAHESVRYDGHVKIPFP